MPASNFQGTSLGVKPSTVTWRDHLAAAHERRHGVEELGRGPTAPRCRSGPHILWAENADEVGVPGLHVDREVRHRLAGVDQHVGAGGVGGVGERADVVDRAEHVRHRADREQLGAVEQAVEVGQVEAVVVGDGDPAQLDAALGGEDVPRHDVGVVLHVREHDGIALAQVGACPRVRDEVDGLGGVADVDDLVRVARVRRTRRPCARAASNAAVASSAIVYTPRWTLALYSR